MVSPPSDVSMSTSNIFTDQNVENMYFSESSNPLKRNLEMNTCSVSPTAKYIPIRSCDDSPFGEDSSITRAKSIDMEDDILEIECVDEGIIGDERNTYSYSNFLRTHSCYEIIPNSSKIIVFDSKLKVKKAFFALVHNNNIRSAPVWDSAKQEFVGMLTVTDFIRILIRYYKSPLDKMWELEEHQIETFRNLTKADRLPYLIRISPTHSIFSAVQMLVQHKIHRLPVIDPTTGNALYVITHKKLLRYIFEHVDDLAVPDFMGFTLKQLGIGTYEKIAMVHPWTTVIEALRIFDEYNVSALPVVDENKRSVDIYSKHDVINLAAERTYNNLDITVEDALRYRQEDFEGVVKCSLDDTLYVIIDRIANAKVHRLVVVDDNDIVRGIVSLSDILKHLVINPPHLDELF